MLLPLSWLKQYLPTLPPAQKLAELLMMHGLEVEAVIDRRGQYDKIVVGEITAIKPHPNADKLRFVSVVISLEGKPQEIVCGAPNITVGQKVPVALVGAKLPNGLTIESRPIRGVSSDGMLCAEDELGLGKDHSGIVVLDPKLKTGTPFATVMGFDDVVFDLAIPANRADLMSVRGVAREIAAVLGKKLKFSPPLSRPRRYAPPRPGGQERRERTISVNVAAPKLCPVYTARVIRGVAVKPSPAWLQNRLRAAGMRPINAVVDATNYVMLDYGQPLHAFDSAKVKQGKITVRAGRVGENLTTLDGQARALDPSILVIADPAGPIALAGIMGGQESEVSAGTTDIILESAIFDAVSIRKTSRKLGLMSEASKRFEKGLWRSLPEEASRAAAALIVELCGGTAEQGSIRAGTGKVKRKTIRFNPKYVAERLGAAVPSAKSKAILTKLGFTISGGITWTATVPEWRLDVSIPEDLVDEVGRMVGYERLPNSFPAVTVVPGPASGLSALREDVKNFLVHVGFTEIIRHSHYGQAMERSVGGSHVEVANPLDTTQQYLRRSLLPHLTAVLEKAADAGQDVSVFEISRVFEGADGDVTAVQPWKLALGMTVRSSEPTYNERKILGVLQALYEHLGLPYPRTAAVNAKSVKNRILLFAELDLETLRIRTTSRKSLSLSKYPGVTRDISLLLSSPRAYHSAEEVIESHGQPLLTKHELLDARDWQGKFNCTIRLTFQSSDRTLTKSEVDKLEAKIKAALEKLGATIR